MASLFQGLFCKGDGDHKGNGNFTSPASHTFYPIFYPIGAYRIGRSPWRDHDDQFTKYFVQPVYMDMILGDFRVMLAFNHCLPSLIKTARGGQRVDEGDDKCGYMLLINGVLAGGECGLCQVTCMGYDMTTIQFFAKSWYF